MRYLTSILLVFSLSGVCSGAVAKTNPVKVAAGSTIEIDPATASGKDVLILQNGSARPVTVLLKAVAATTPKAPQGKIVFVAESQPEPEVKKKPAGKQEPPASKPPGAEVKVGARGSAAVDVTITGQAEAGDFEATIVDDTTGAELGKLRFRRQPFSVKLVGPDPEKLEAALVDGQRSEIQLRNDDARAYKLDWELHADDKPVCGGSFEIAPGGLALIVCTPGSEIRHSTGTEPGKKCWWPGFFSHPRNLIKQDPARDGGKLILYAAQETGKPAGAPLKVFSAKASLNYHSATVRDPVKFLLLVLVLSAGGLLSLFLSFFLPNRLRELNLSESLGALARSTADLSTRLDSRLGVMLRLERSRLRDLLKSRHTYSPDFAGVASQADAGIAQLRSRVQLAQQMDLVSGRLENSTSEDVPPSKLAKIIAGLSAATGPLTKSEASSADLQEAQAAIAKADDIVKTLDQPDDDFGRDVAKRIKELLADVKTPAAANVVFVALCKDLSGPFDRLSAFAGDIAPAATAAALDMDIEKVRLLYQFACLVTGTTDTEIITRLQSHLKDLRDLLQRGRWQDLQSARLLIREMKDDVYPERIKEKLETNGLHIDVNPPVAYDSAPIELSVAFYDPRLEGCAAREEWICEWDFGDGLTGRGWVVSHYYVLPSPTYSIGQAQAKGFKVKVGLRGADGKLAGILPFQAGIQSAVSPTSSKTGAKAGADRPTDELIVRPRSAATRDRASLEFIKLGATLLIAVFGLVAGAQQQLDQLDVMPGLVAIFLVGFGADTIKNLLTQTPAAPKTPPTVTP